MRTQAKATAFAREWKLRTTSLNAMPVPLHRISWGLFSIVNTRDCLDTMLVDIFWEPQLHRQICLSLHCTSFSALLKGVPITSCTADTTPSCDLQQNLFKLLCQHKTLMNWVSFPLVWRLLSSASGMQVPWVNEHLPVKGGQDLDLSVQGRQFCCELKEELT